MNGTRFLARVAKPGAVLSAFDRRPRPGGEQRATIADIGPAGIQIETIGQPVLRVGDDCVIIGPLFQRNGRAVASINSDEAQRILAQGPGGLIEHHWGGYVAVFCLPCGAVQVLRAPLGELPCFFTETDEAWIVASDVSLAREGGYRVTAIDWEVLRYQLAAHSLGRSATALQGLREVAGGHCLTLSGDTARTQMLWSPWTFAAPSQRIEDRVQAVALVASVARTCVAARASAFERIVLMLSGGLDSSIVAACLHHAGTKFAALNMVTRDAAGDERHHARRVAHWLDAPLHEEPRDVEQIDVTRSLATRLPRPGVRVFFQESTRLTSALAERTSAQAIFNGGGGDNVFCSLQSSSPAADRLRTSGLDRAFLRTAIDISRLAPASLSSVIADAVRRAWLGKPALKPARDFSLMSPAAWQSIASQDDHPWLELPRRVMPGTAAQVRLLAIAQNFVENSDPQNRFACVAPLMAQPLVEACLRVPTWLWLEQGHNRAIARRAFADALPLDIVLRRSKGSPDSFIAEIFERHRRAIRALLADGHLASRRIIDIDAVLAVIDDPRPARYAQLQRILELVDFEAWTRAWI